MTLKPWIGYITLVDVEYDDKEIVVPVEDYLGGGGGGILRLMSASDTVKYKQGIAAGIVVATGEGVPSLEPGSKVYYARAHATQIGDEKIVHANYVLGYEEAHD